MKRRFAAIGLPAALRDALEMAIGPVRQRWPQFGWTDPDGWHVTLAFLGVLADDRLEDAQQVLTDVVGAHAADRGVPDRLRARTADAYRFGGRVLSLEVVDEPQGRITALGTALQAALAHAQLPVSRREVRPHVTLARGRHKRPVTDVVVREVNEAIAERIERNAAVGAAIVAGWPVDAVGLWTAHDGDGPARYELTAEVAWSSS